MRHLPLGEVRALCARLVASRANDAAVERLVRDAVRQRVLDKDSLPLIVQNVGVVQQQWQLALRVLQSRHVQTHRVRLDANIWRILAPALPRSGDDHAAAQRVLCALPWEQPKTNDTATTTTTTATTASPPRSRYTRR